MNDTLGEEKGFKVSDRRRFAGVKSKGDVKEEEPKERPTSHQKEEESQKGEVKGTTLPPPDFSIFISSLATSVLYHMGDIPDPQTGKREKNLHLAKHTIDTIAMLKEKTKGNLTDDETRLVDEYLYNLRMRYIKETGQ